MKELRLFLLTALLTMVGNASADELIVRDFGITKGETKSISIELDNPKNDYQTVCVLYMMRTTI